MGKLLLLPVVLQTKQNLELLWVHFVLGNKDSQKGFGGKGVAVDLSTNYDVSLWTQNILSCAHLSS